jgi:hypothetical protein
LGDLTDAENLIDPYSNRLFEYYPAFLLSAGESQLSIRPGSSIEAQILVTGAPPIRFTIAQLTSSLTADIEKMNEAASETRWIAEHVYPIPVANVESSAIAP